MYKERPTVNVQDYLTADDITKLSAVRIVDMVTELTSDYSFNFPGNPIELTLESRDNEIIVVPVFDGRYRQNYTGETFDEAITACYLAMYAEREKMHREYGVTE
jgi:hypothetical protein